MELLTVIESSVTCGALAMVLGGPATACGQAVTLDEPAMLSMSAVAAPNHHFHCNTGYTTRTCTEQLKRLQDVLSGMDLAPLGEWTWILVRSDDWKPILRRVGCDPDSPAFTILEKRQTFLEEALFNPSQERGQKLLEKWRVPLDQLLLVAVAHELGHALCRETDEARTIRYADELHRTGTVTCATESGRPHLRN
ncbi:MAG TPA: hypothetical protein VHI99_07800 [Vicinamibacterales bacterium]|jgi:hypothetical protein|nr:hypothetical protein [Vicinamibacterales bacterium]